MNRVPHRALMIVLLAMAGAPVAVPADDEALRTLLQQAEYWRDNNRDDLAARSLERVLSADPDQPVALYELGIIALDNGDEESFQTWLTRLQQAAPGSPEARRLEQARQRRQMDASQLRDARRLAQAGDSSAALRQYERLFGGESPPDDVALEYYQTMAAVPGRWQDAETGLRRLSAARPDDARVSLAHAEVLTYHPPTRREGLDKLQLLWADQPSSAVRNAWRQGVLWLDPSQRNIPYFQRYLVAQGSDREVADRLTLATRGEAGQDRAAGFAALESEQDAAALAAFRRAIARDPDDADAHGGLGLAQLRAGNFAAAGQSLDRAIRLAPERATQWRDARDTARFYAELSAVRQLGDAGRVEEALTRVAPLTRAPGDRGREAQLVQGELALQQGDAVAAEDIFRALLASQPGEQSARIGLMRALLAQNRLDEAEGILASLPPAVREDYDNLRVQRAAALREQAQMHQARGETRFAQRTLEQAVRLTPQDPWVRLDLARLLNAEGEQRAARTVMARVDGVDAEDSALQASALLALEQSRWDDALTLLGRIPETRRDADSRAMMVRAERGRRVEGVARQLQEGDTDRVAALLQGLYLDPPTDSAELGELSIVLHEAGETRLALALVRRDLASGVDNSAPLDYVNHAVLLARTGQDDESERLLTSLVTNSDAATQRQILALRRDLSLAEAERRRADEDLAGAYEVLTAALDREPEHVPLLLALARLYEQGGMHDEARQVRDHVLASRAGDQDARAAAVSGALAAGDTREARRLLAEVAPISDPQLLLLAARTENQAGRPRSALRYARDAREAEARQISGDNVLQQDNWRAAGYNPFARQQAQQEQLAAARRQHERAPLSAREAARESQRNSRSDSRRDGSRPAPERQVWLPGQSRERQRWQPDDDDADWMSRPWYNAPETEPDWRALAQTRPTSPAVSANSPRLREIDSLVQELEQSVAPHAQAGLNLRRRSGESGLSALTEVSSDLTLAVVPFGSGRLSLRASPVYINAGTLRGDSADRFGTGPIAAGAEAADEALAQVQPLLDGITEVAFQFDAAEQQLAAAIASGTATPQEIQQLETNRDAAFRAFEAATARNVLFEAGIDLDRLSADQRAFLDDFLLAEFGTSDVSLESADLAEFLVNSARLEQLVADVRGRAIATARAGVAPGNQQQSGAGFGLGWQWQSVSAEIGLSPAGFEVSNVLGSLSWNPRLSDSTGLGLSLRRRSVTDSVLSWAGVKDRTSGDSWGGVVRTGGEIMLTFDDGYFGLFGSLGGDRYTGHNVADNTAFSMGVGSYLRPVNDGISTVQVGINMNYLTFDENLSYFTFGHGGYFSPQDYVSLSFPISYQRRQGLATWTLSAAPGFQSYSQDEADFFPTRGAQQRWIDILATAGVLPASGYAASSESGMGLNLGAQLDYQIAPGLRLGAALGHDTFGEYAETTARLHIHYTGGR